MPRVNATVIRKNNGTRNEILANPPTKFKQENFTINFRALSYFALLPCIRVIILIKIERRGTDNRGSLMIRDVRES